MTELISSSEHPPSRDGYSNFNSYRIFSESDSVIVLVFIVYSEELEEPSLPNALAI